jgi:hypothetical protein
MLFVQQQQEDTSFCPKQIAECDRNLEGYLQHKPDRSQGASLPVEKRKERLKKTKKAKPQFDLRAAFFRTVGTDLTRIDSIDVMAELTILSEAGWDMSKWKTEDHFVSWLGLCPGQPE